MIGANFAESDMKITEAKQILSGLLLGMMLICSPLLASSNNAGEKNYNSDQVNVSWTDPAKFTEARYGPQLNQTKPEVWLTELQKTLVKRAGAVLKPGQHLDIKFTDVDLAGHVEPLYDGRTNVRVVKSIYPPEIKLSFTLTGTDGQVLDSGERKLRDIAFLDRGTVSSNDPYRFEKRLLKDWVSTEFGKRSKD